MLYSEFYDRTGVAVTMAEYYDAIQPQYNAFKGNKDAFCRAWCRANANRVAEARNAIRMAEEHEKQTKKAESLLLKWIRGRGHDSLQWYDIDLASVFSGCDLSVAWDVVRAISDGKMRHFVSSWDSRKWDAFRHLHDAFCHGGKPYRS